MSETVVALTIELDAAWAAAGAVQVFTNQGSGDVDTSKPLLGRARPIRKLVTEPRGLGRDPLGGGALGGGATGRADKLGLGEIPLGRGPLGGEVEVVTVEVAVDPGFGYYKFAARAVDPAGNAQGAAVVESDHFISSEDPPELTGLTFVSHDDGTDQCTFGFTL
jgi:hypothetical protein